MNHAVVYEKGKLGYGAYVPDLHGCVAVGKTLACVQQLIGEAIELHIQSLHDEGELGRRRPLSQPRSGGRD